MKTFKMVIKGDGIFFIRVDHPYSKEFEYMGYTWVIHRPYENKSGFKVSEKSTGFGIANLLHKTIKEAKIWAETVLDDKGQERLDARILEARNI